MNAREQWLRFRRYLCAAPTLGMQLDVSRMNFPDGYLEDMTPAMAAALAAMDELERGAKANVSEDRMVGHYWLRVPELAPNPAMTSDIRRAIEDVRRFASDVHSGGIRPQSADGFYVVLVIGIGGSALGPQLLYDALGGSDDPLIVRFIDNTDADGMDRIIAELDESLAETLTIVISKSGGTKETRNGNVEVAEAYGRVGLDFARHAVAVTGAGSVLAQTAKSENWLATFPIWDWVGGRTSVTSCVGLLPAALAGIDVDAFLAGARECDEVTRSAEISCNPAALMSLMWHYAGNGQGARNMVVLPYKDRLGLLGRYLQQLVMESLGKKYDRSGKVVHQGLTVYGNKGSTDQHAYVQQLREGPDDFFVTFINVLRDRDGESVSVEEDVTSGDYLNAFWQGTRDALHEAGRESMTLTLDRLDARRLGALVALFERTVGLYAELVDVNAYDQPGVEAGKKAAGAILDLQRRVLAYLRTGGKSQTVEEIASALGEPESVETIHHALEHAAENPDHGVVRHPGGNVADARYGIR